MDRHTDGQTDRRMYAQRDGQKVRRMDGWTDGWMDGHGGVQSHVHATKNIKSGISIPPSSMEL